ncbi:MAG: hypothetical protein ACOYN0_00785 [Phycisphaerales bacterium]
MADNRDGGGWGSGSSPKSEENVWAKAQSLQSQREADARDPAAAAQRRKSKRRTVILSVLGVLVAVLVVLVALAPAIAGSFAPGIIESQAGKYISGQAKVASVSLSWWGPQRVAGVQLLDKGNEVVGASLSVDAGLLSLATGNLDLGDVVLDKGSVKVVKEQGGAMNLERLLAPPTKGGASKPSGGGSGSAGSSPAIPKALRAALKIKDLKVQYTDRSVANGADVTLKDFDLTMNVQAGAPLKLKAKGTASNAADPSKAGEILADIKVERWSNESGELTIKKIKTESQVEIKDLPVALLEAFVPGAADAASPHLVAGLGQTLSVTVNIAGAMGELTAKASVASTGARASADLAWAKGQVTTTTPLEVTVTGNALTELVPAIKAGLAGQDAAVVDAFPDVSVKVENLKVPYEMGKALDLRGGGVKVTVATTRTAGTLKLAEGRARQPFELSPLGVTIEAKDLASGLTVAARTDLAIDGSRAGEIAVDANCGGVLDAKGMPAAGLPPELRGSAVIRNIATAILQPFVAGAGLDLPTDLGPTLDVQLTAAAGKSTGTGVPPTDLELKVTSRELTADAQVAVMNEGIQAKENGVRVRLASLGRLASRFVKPETGWEVVAGEGGEARVVVQGLALPRDPATGRYQLELLRSKTEVSLSGITARSLSATESPVRLGTFSLVTDTSKGAVKVTLSADATLRERPFSISGEFDVPGMLVAPRALPGGGTSVVADVASIRPEGVLNLTNVPVEAAALAGSGKAVEGQKPLDLVGLLTGAVGPTVSVAVTSTPVRDGQGYDFVVSAKAQRLDAGVSTRMEPGRLSLKSATVTTTVDEGTVSALLRQFAPDIQGAPRLAAPTRIELTMSPISVALDSASNPRWLEAGAAGLNIEAKGRTLVDGLSMKQADGSQRPLGRVGIEGLKVTASTPVAILLGVGQPGARTASVTLGGNVIGPADSQLCALAFSAQAELEAGKPAGPANVSVQLSDLDTRQLEQILGQDGLYSGALGASASVRVDASALPPAGSTGAMDFNAATINVAANFEAKNLRTNGPLKAVISPVSIAVTDPAKFTLRVEPKTVNALMEHKPKPGEPARSPESQLTMSEPATFELTINSFTLPRTKAAKFAVNTSLQTAGLNMMDGKGRAITVAGLVLRAATDASAPTPPLTFLIEAASAGVGEYKTTKPLRLAGQFENVVNKDGAFDFAKALLSVGGNIEGIPTALVDALAQKDGMLVDALGDNVNVFVEAKRVPLENFGAGAGPAIEVRATSPRASATVKGSIADNIFNTSAPIEVNVVEVTRALAARYLGSVPIFESVEKNRETHRPATISATELHVPMNNDMSKLNGAVVLDPGEIDFKLSEGLGELVGDKIIKQKGVVGQRLLPVYVSFTNGLGNLQRYKFPLGEFTIELEGEVNLVTNQVDIITWLPATMLADEAVGSIVKLLPGGSNPLIGASEVISAVREYVPLVPFRTRGPLNAPKPSLLPDTQLIMAEFERNGGWSKLLQKALEGKAKDLINLPDLLKPKLPQGPVPK